MKACTCLALFLLFSCSIRHSGREDTLHLPASKTSILAKRYQNLLKAHPGESGVVPLVDGELSLAARLVALRDAERSLDLQYYLWNNDHAGKLLLKKVMAAAERGVKVRLLMDSYFESKFFTALKILNQHKNIEVRLVNPGLRYINHRMHNKSFTVDNQVSIVGGRNIGDGYFESSDAHNYKDYEFYVVGPVVEDISDQFDQYWNSQRSFGMSELDQLPVEDRDKRKAEEELSKVQDMVPQPDLEKRLLELYWGPAKVLYDPPEKLEGEEEDTLSMQIRPGINTTENDLILISPYFIPGKEGMKILKQLRKKGVHIVVITNSLQSNDNFSVFSGYKKYRKELLRIGIELYEFKHEAPSSRKGRIGTSGSIGVHGKVMVRDGTELLVGSMNVDPRSRTLNTEMGILFHNGELASLTVSKLMQILPDISYRLKLDDEKVMWIEGNQIHKVEPGSSWWKDFKSDISSLLVPEQLI